MTLLTGILDPDPLRTSRFLEGSRKLAPDLAWLKHTDTRLGHLSLSLDGAPRTPYSTFQDSGGRSVFVLGDIILPNTETGTDNAAWLNQQCIERGPEMLGRQNGYYLAGMIDQHDVVYLAADQLGLMPLYYWAGTDHFCFSTSPNAFISHPHFNTTPDLMGVAGILLTMHATGNRTTWQDVRRLPPGHLLRWRKGEGITLSDVNSLKAHDSHFGWPPSRCQDLIQNSFNEAVQRLDKLGETAVLLSGGLDSRLVAGCLRWHARYKAPAVTLGESTDYEMQCARRVAASLGWPMHPVPVKLDAYPSWARIQARLEGMQTSFVEFMWWQATDTVNRLKPRIMTGLLGDAIMGGSQIGYGFDDQTGQHAFATQFTRLNRYGHSPAAVSKLLGQTGLGEAVLEELNKTWSSYDGLPFQKCWLYDLHHRQRLHVAPAAWRLSFGAWPSLPFTDRDHMQAMAGMAAPAFTERCAQNSMLRYKFPKLAALPLDRGGPDMRPLAPTPMWRLKHYLSSRVSMLRPGAGQIERRQYVRHFDINGPGWQAIRQLAEGHRSKMGNLFNPDVLEEMLPLYEHPLSTPDAVVDGARYKTMMGLFMQLSAPSSGDEQ
jgi:asparagine synthase (glutamine-hydrolysing)